MSRGASKGHPPAMTASGFMIGILYMSSTHEWGIKLGNAQDAHPSQMNCLMMALYVIGTDAAASATWITVSCPPAVSPPLGTLHMQNSMPCDGGIKMFVMLFPLYPMGLQLV